MVFIQGCGSGSAFFPPGFGSRKEKFKNKHRINVKEIGTVVAILLSLLKVNLDQLYGYYF